MPELPEVETIRRGLEDRLVGKVIEAIEVRAPKIFEGEPDEIIGLEVLSLQRQGKLLIFFLSSNMVVTIHLKMTGQLIWKPAAGQEMSEELLDVPDNATMSFEDEGEDDEEEELVAVMGGHPEKSYLDPLPHKHTHVIFSFDDGSKLYFNDLRKFGRITILSIDQLASLSFLERLGPEPLGADFTQEYLMDQLHKRPKQPVKSFLLDQSNIAGLGNIYADESLFRSAILPDRLTGSLTTGEITNLHEAVQETLEIALQHGGSSSKDYVNAVGDKGTFLAVANVYHRTGLNCNRCLEGIIQRKKIGGRSSHYCINCQR
jgi:formamidopyrimidine-DNA glycosylase